MALLHLYNLGRTPYAEVHALQRQLHAQVMRENHPDVLVLCEHQPVITLGRSAKAEHVLLDRASLQARGIEYYEVERGGDVTYHGPGQLVAYPILNLTQHRRDVDWYMRSLEQVIIAALQCCGVLGEARASRTGVWISDVTRAAKIASIGVRISRWCTWHGLAVNVQDCKQGFELIYPCGFRDIEITSLQEEGQCVSVESFAEVLKQRFVECFGYTEIEHESSKSAA